MRSKALSALALLIPTFAHAQDQDRHGLKGISAVEVLVENLTEEARKIGLTKADIQTDVELRLRSAGLKVISEEESLKTPGSETLYVNVTLSDGRAANVEVYLQQAVLLARDREQWVSGATTWNGGFVILSPSARDIRDAVKDLVDRFLNEWLKINPRK